MKSNEPSPTHRHCTLILIKRLCSNHHLFLKKWLNISANQLNVLVHYKRFKINLNPNKLEICPTGWIVIP